MLCGYCKKKFRGIRSLSNHWKTTGCPMFRGNRRAWEKHLAAKDDGRSGRRILSKAFPETYKPAPMSDEAKEKLRALGEKRKAFGIKVPRRRRRSS